MSDQGDVKVTVEVAGHRVAVEVSSTASSAATTPDDSASRGPDGGLREQSR